MTVPPTTSDDSEPLPDAEAVSVVSDESPSASEKKVDQEGRGAKDLLSEWQAALITVTLGLIWATMVWWVQSLTTAPTLWKEPLMLVKDQAYRFLIDWGLATFLLARLAPRWVAFLLALNAFVAGAILSFFLNYQRALSWLTIKSQSGEGAAVFMVALDDASPYLAVILPVSLGLWWVFFKIHPRLGKQKRLQWLAGLLWFSVLSGMHIDHKPLSRLANFESADGVAHGYGFAITWLAEAYYISLDGIADDALARLKEPVDGLLQQVPPVELGDRLVVIQVESLDDAVMGFKIEGVEVVPRLNRWAAQGSYLRVQAIKLNGSCDSDFALLFGALASTRMAPYRIPAFPFDRAIVGPLHERGLATSFYHGVSGTFFERRTAFEEMSFDRIVFREELIESLKLKDPEWTITDGEMFRLAEKERKNQERFFEFSITGTSHTPFRFSLEGFERKFFPGVRDRHFNYFDTIAYVDEVMGKYVDGLPTGTVVVVYGDHWSRVENPELGYKHQMIDEFGIVPMLLFRKTETGAEPLFEVDDALALSAKIRLVDATAWLRKSLHIAPAYEK